MSLIRHPSFREGRTAGIPFAVASFILAATFGVLAKTVMGTVAPIVMSTIVYAGSAQFGALAVLAAGFWLSFVGVGFLMLCLQSRGRGLRAFLHELTAGQLVMTVALLPLTMWFFGQASLVGALSNLIAVPLVSFVIVPCALGGMLMLGLCPPLAGPVLWLAARMAHAQW